MATFLDITVLESFAGIFTWLLIFVIAFGILEVVSPFGEGRSGFNAIISFVLAFLVIFTEPARFIVDFIVPWMTVAFLGIFFLLFLFMAFGVEGETIAGWGTSKKIRAPLIIIAVVIALFGVGNAFDDTNDYPTGEGTLPEQVGEYNGGAAVPPPPAAAIPEKPSFVGKVVLTFTHPKVLGTVFALLLGSFTIAFLSKESSS